METEGLTMDIMQFEKQEGLLLILEEQQPGKWAAKFANTDIANFPLIEPDYGIGATEEEAIKNYCNILSNKVIITDKLYHTERGIQCPELTYSPKREKK